MSNNKWCTTVDGKEINLFDPDPSIFTVDRIANALARINRFAGHWHNPISVARHSMRVADILRNDGCDIETQLQGLFHDAAEAFTTDIPSPLKKLLFIATPITGGQVTRMSGFDCVLNPEPNCKSFYEFEDVLLGHIFNRLEIECPLRPEVHAADEHLTKQECSWVKVESAGSMAESSCLYSPRTSTNPYVVAIAFKYKADELFAARSHAADMPAGASK
jgi:hypothetical protein